MGILIICLSFIYRLKLKAKRLKMALTLDERVEIVLLSGRQRWTQRHVADEFNARHPERNPITHSAVGKLVKKFKETGSVVDKPRVGGPSVGEDIRTGAIAKFHAHSSWFQTLRTPAILCAKSSLILKHLLYTNFILQVLVSEHFSRICLATSSRKHREHLPFSHPVMIPLKFQIPAFNDDILILSFLVHKSI
jgi:hypothetical protein